MYEHTSHHIRIFVNPQFLENQSEPDNGKFVWAYTITMQNQSPQTVKLLTRHWVITDGLGRTQEVKGQGVIGEQPVLRPGESFQYTSGCPLSTPSGMMKGSYGMINAQGQGLEVIIPAFSLDSPYDKHSVN